MALLLKLKTQIDMSDLFSPITNKVAVNYCLYDRNKQTIIKYSSSRACGKNHNRPSIHAEQFALMDLHNYKNNNKIDIFIWRYDNSKNIKSCYCCNACTQLLKKYNITNIYTFNNNKIESAIVKNPEVSLAYKIKNKLL